MQRRILLYHIGLTLSIALAALTSLVLSEQAYPFILGISGLTFVLMRKTSIYKHHPLALPLIALVMLATAIVLQTGTFSSPFFPLLYLSMLTTAFLIRSQVALTSTIALIIVLLLHEPQGLSSSVIIHLLFLTLMTPFALLLSHEKVQLELKETELEMESRRKELYQKAYRAEKDKTNSIKENIKKSLASIEKENEPKPTLGRELSDILKKIDTAGEQK
ncbi:MAG: hypothetical protein UZ21_OP11001000914 [Microgenomates bacterium OLB22]|nr:MAG: hypothetical protein UZ21_OP11001000914 [Microgenomates bacterium OLB22]